MKLITYANKRLQFVTGRLAASATEEIVAKLSEEIGYQYTVDVLPITVAALMTPKWLARHLIIADQTDYIVLPGYLEPNLENVRSYFPQAADRIVCGPRDIRDLPEFFGKKRGRPADYGSFDIEILAEINHAPRLSIADIVQQAKQLKADGADLIDVGCDPNARWTDVGLAVRALREEGLRVSIDSFDSWEVEQACRAGAELVLSVNSSNREAACDWGAEVVLIPDQIGTLEGLDENIEWLSQRGIRLRIDPILEPLGVGFAASLQRYMETRNRWPEAEILMGIGNITELTDADSAGVNVLLLGICQELGIRSILTTQVINWARSAVRECDLARRLVYYARRNKIPPKHLEPRLVTLRDPKIKGFSSEILSQLATTIRDNNYRIFAQDGEVHLLSANLHLHDEDPFELMGKLMELPQSSNVDPSHAFYLGFEMAKAMTALTLGKQYEQDQALQWGYLTRFEKHHRLPRRSPQQPPPS
jgi:dihydropteroate synthase